MNLFDFLFPPVCPHCGTHVQQQGDWCDACIEEVLHVRQVPSKLLSSLDSAWILADYRGGIKSMIYDVKFNEKKEQSKGAAPFLASYNLRMHDYRPHYVIPIPSSAEKKKVRGYNQVDLFFYDWVFSFSNSNRIDGRSSVINGLIVYIKWIPIKKCGAYLEVNGIEQSIRHLCGRKLAIPRCYMISGFY